MSIVSIKKLKEISERSKETQLIDLGKFIDKSLEGIAIPIKVKTFEEVLKIKENCKVKEEKLTIEYKPFIRMPKSFRDLYMKSENYRAGISENTYFQLCKVSDDESKIDRNKYRERLFNILIHIDMDYIVEENGKTMWEDTGLSKGDYNGLIEIFSNIIVYEKHLDILDVVIDKLKSGITDEAQILASVFQYGISKTIENIEDETERKIFIDNVNQMIEQAQKNTKDVTNDKK